MARYENETPKISEEELIANTRVNQNKYKNPIPIVMGIVRRGDKILVIKKDVFQKYWHFVAGFVDIGESVEEAAQREVLEETGITAKIFKFLGTFPYFDEKAMLMTVFEMRYVSGEAQPSKEAQIVEWLEPKDEKLVLREGSLAQYIFKTHIVNR